MESNSSLMLPEQVMVRPSVLAIGIGIGALLLGGSGIAIPTLWSRAQRAEDDRGELETALKASRQEHTKSRDALEAAQQQLADLQAKLASEQQTLAATQENKRVLTNELAALQQHNRDLTATSGTLELRDTEMAALVEELEQVRSDYKALLATRKSTTPSDSSQQGHDIPPDDVPTRDQIASREPIESADLVPVPPLGTIPTSTTPQPMPIETQTVAKPDTSKPAQFDDRGWKTVASSN